MLRLRKAKRMSGLFWRRSWRMGGKALYCMRPKPPVQPCTDGALEQHCPLEAEGRSHMEKREKEAGDINLGHVLYVAQGSHIVTVSTCNQHKTIKGTVSILLSS